MQPIITKLEDLGRRLPEPARGLLRKLRDAYRQRTAKPAPAPAPTPVPDPEPEPVRKPKAKNWELSSQAELVAHIEGHYHAGLRRDLPALIKTARALEREHATFPRELAEVLATFASELESHMLKEETMLFPELRSGARGGMLDMPMRMMEREHDGHDDQLARIRELTSNLAAPADATPAWRELYAQLGTLEADLRQHIYLENNILFARATTGER